MTFPFSNHNYQLRFWMAAGGMDPDEDVRLVVLPPPYMVESLASEHVDAFCVGAPWNSVAVDLGVGSILHFGCEIMAQVSEKVLALRQRWADENPDTVCALVRALARATEFADQAVNREHVAHIVAQRLGTTSELVVRTLTGNLKTSPDGSIRKSDRYIVVGPNGANRPDPIQAAWAYAQIVRWGQAPLSRNCKQRPKTFSAPTSMMRHSGTPIRQGAALSAKASGRSSAHSSMPATLPVTWRRGGRNAHSGHSCLSFVDFALHKYSAVCAVRKHRSLVL